MISDERSYKNRGGGWGWVRDMGWDIRVFEGFE